MFNILTSSFTPNTGDVNHINLMALRYQSITLTIWCMINCSIFKKDAQIYLAGKIQVYDIKKLTSNPQGYQTQFEDETLQSTNRLYHWI